MTAVAASKVRPTFVQRIAAAYVEAAVFALGELAEANKSVLYFAEHGEGRGDFDAHLVAMNRARFWQLEAANCEGLVLLLEGTADGQ